ncbi:MAG: ATP-binding protein [Chloroflexota bacterium]
MAFFVAGVALVTVTAIGIRGPLAVLASLGAALALLILVVSFAITGGWTGVAVYSVFLLATILSLFCDTGSTPGEQNVDLFVVTAAVAAILNGCVLFGLSVTGTGVFYDPLRSSLVWHSALFLLGGVSVLAARLWIQASRLTRSVTQLILGLAFLAWLTASAAPNWIWTGMLFYGGIGIVLILGPRLARWAGRLDASSLRLRLALAMASAAAFPLLAVATVATGWEEHAAADQQLALQQALASGLGADLNGALTQHLVGLTLVAEHPVVLSRSAAGREALLGDVGEVAPGFLSIGTFDGTGRPSMVLGRQGADATGRLPVIASEAITRIPVRLPSPTVFVSAADRAIALAVPVRQPGGGLDGVAVGELDRHWLAERLQRGIADAPVSTVVIDGAGRLVVSAGEPLAGLDSLANRPSVQAVRTNGSPRGSLRFSTGSRDYLAGYARIPDTDWAVVVEQPAAVALASVWVSRELTFVVLIAAFLVASALGVMLADRLAAPLALLARAAQVLATGSPTSVIPHSRIYEVRVLARAFAEMQARLLARTSERERAEARFRILASASGELTRSLDETAIINALARIVVHELADWCTVDTLNADGTLQCVDVLHADARRQALAATLLTVPPIGGTTHDHPGHSGASLLFTTVTPKQLVSLSHSPEHRRTLEWLGMRSLMVVPLRVRDQTIGSLTCVLGRGGRRYGADDLALAQELGLRAALAIDNARLFAAEHAARADAEAAVRVRDEFLAVAAHELKTPITSLRGFAELGVRTLNARGSLEPALARRTLETIERQSARLGALVANLLEVARDTATRTSISPRSINVAELIRLAVETARVRAPEHSFTLEGPETAEILGDPLRLEQVITNLLDNAVKYSPPDTLIEVSVQATEDTVDLVVRDHGMGIPPEHHERIFDRYFQAHPGGETSGMGLGLYISQQIIQGHGGVIRAELPEDGGVRMIVTLPRESSAAVPQPPSQESPEAAASA